jgi:hypothetical protein
MKLKIKIKQQLRNVGWAGVRSVLSTHCSAAKLHSKRRPTAYKFKVIKSNFCQKKDEVLIDHKNSKLIKTIIK